MREQIRGAALVFVLFSMTTFASFAFLASGYGDWISKFGLLTGIFLGTLYSSMIAQRPANPIRFGFPFKPYKPSSGEQQLMTLLIAEWKQFPRYYFWLATIPYLIVLGLVTIFTRHKSPYPWINLSYFMSFTFFGFIPGVSLSWGVFFLQLSRRGFQED